MGKKRKSKAQPVKIDANDVRVAVHHLIELAAGFERRGADAALRKGEKSDVLAVGGWKPTEEDETFGDDERCLRKVIDLLLAHRRRQQEAQRNAFIEGLIYTLSQMYRAYRRDPEIPALTLQISVQKLCDHLALEVGDEELDLLVPERGDKDDTHIDGDADSLHAMEGAVESAKTIVSKLVGLSFRTIRDIRDYHAHPLAFARRPFGRYVPRQGRFAYVAELYEQLERVTANPSIGFAEIRGFDEAISVAVDRVVENLLARTVEDPAFRAAVLPQEMRVRMAATEEKDATRLRAHVSALVKAGPSAVAASGLPETLRKAALAVAEAVVRGTPAVEKEALEQGLESSIQETARQVLVDAMRTAARETFGAELDTIKKR